MTMPEKIWMGREIKTAEDIDFRQAYIRADIADELARALLEIAREKRTDELITEYDVEVADFEAAHDMFIDRARSALARYRQATAD